MPYQNSSLSSSSDDPPNFIRSANPQFTPNSLKCIVATIILNEVEKKNIMVEDFLFAYKAVKTPTNPKAPPK